MAKAKKVAKKKVEKFVTVTNVRSYGNNLKGVKIYYEGKKPKGLKADGTISFGKAILELLKKTFTKYQWIITEDKDEITETYGITRFRTSIKTLAAMQKQSYDRGRDIKQDIIKKTFSIVYPQKFQFSQSIKYKPGDLALLLKENILSGLSTDDKNALNKFLPDYIAQEASSAVNLLKASTQIKTLKQIVADLRTEIKGNRSEPWWQDYIHKNILIIQQGYIHAIEKMNISIGNTKFPDFSLITHDGFLDILEIKRPNTELIQFDKSRNNYYWDSEISRAIIQVENYIENVLKFSDAVRTYIKDNFKIELKVVRPRGIILAGDSSIFTQQKQKDDFRLLSQATKNITFLTYDELATRLENYIGVLEKHSVKVK
jgi:hypothetical protein